MTFGKDELATTLVAIRMYQKLLDILAERLNCAELPVVVCEVKGGMIQAIYSDALLRVIVVDWDSESLLVEHAGEEREVKPLADMPTTTFAAVKALDAAASKLM